MFSGTLYMLPRDQIRVPVEEVLTGHGVAVAERDVLGVDVVSVRIGR